MAENITQSYRLNNILLRGYDLSIEPSELAIVDNTVRVQEGIAKAGDIIMIDSVKYLVTEALPSINGVEIAKSSAAMVLAQGSNKVDLLVYPMGSTDNNTPLDAHKALNRPADITNVARATWSARAVTAKEEPEDHTENLPTETVVRGSIVEKKEETPVTGAAQDPKKVADEAILDFARFAGTLAFQRMLTNRTDSSTNESIHTYLTGIMSSFYHQLYYVPNLRNNYAILVKPETLFIPAPSCNLVFPNIKYGINYSRAFKQEPTRLMHVTDPLASIKGTHIQEPFKLYSFMFVEDRPTTIDKDGLPVHTNYIESLSSGHTNLTNRTLPLTNITNFEQRNGIRCSTVNKGSDLYLYLVSKDANLSEKDLEYSNVQSVANDTATLQGVGKTLGRLAQYELARQRYSVRTGSVNMYFNPYVVPGFPMASIETTSDGLNIYGYITSVVHDLSERSWATTINFNCAHDDLEELPGAFPIIEAQYTESLDTTYKDMLGDTVTAIRNGEITNLVNEYGNDKNFITQSYRKIWRETLSLDEYLTGIADGAKEQEGNGYTWIQNAPGSNFFNEELQNRLKQYTEQIMTTHRAFHADDVR
jgi:hypothetical protein